MKGSIKSEVRKLFSVRSTYILLGAALGLDIFFSFYISGWRADKMALSNPMFLSSQVVQAISFLTLFSIVAAILLVTHEYRYNTISYTLTGSKSRSRAFFAKYATLTGFAIIFSLFFGLLSPLLTAIGLHAHNLSLVHQHYDLWSAIWRSVFYGWGSVTFAFILASIIKHQVGSVVAIFLFPSTFEQLLGLLIKQNQIYLPYTALDGLVDNLPRGNHISHHTSVVVTSIYIVTGLLVSWYLFLHRDAQ